MGQQRYPKAKELTITADRGGSNSVRAPGPHTVAIWVFSEAQSLEAAFDGIKRGL